MDIESTKKSVQTVLNLLTVNVFAIALYLNLINNRKLSTYDQKKIDNILLKYFK